MVKIEIDGRQLEANAGDMLIAVADREAIAIPRFCYHKKLSVAANCRMCLVDIEGSPKAQPACSTPITQDMKVHTKNIKAKSAQKAVMEFLLINHPLDCPICDQGGECELQDVAMQYGSDMSKFSEDKRVVADHDIGALIQTDMTRCIHCTRCVRFGVEVAGIMEMGSTGRGENLKIEPFLNQSIDSELSGNMIDVCPVGALTSKPFRYELRTWQMNAIANIARHDLVGSNIYTQVYKGKVKRIVAKDNDAVNETWIADRDRFSYEGLTHKNRLLTPMIKVENQWQQVEWKIALDFAVKGLNIHILKNRQHNQLGALATNNATFEEFYMLRKLLTKIGSKNFDYRLNISNLDDPIVLASNIKLIALENIEHALIIGSNPRLEQPMINHRLRKANLKGGTIDVINVMKFDFNYTLSTEKIASPNNISIILGAILKAILKHNNKPLPAYLTNIDDDKDATKLAQRLLLSNKSVIVLGEHIVNSVEAATIAKLIVKIAENTNSSTLNLTDNSNFMAADLSGFVPTKTGLHTNSMLEADLRAYILLEVYPQHDFYDAKKAIDTLKKQDTFVISLNSFNDKAVANYANVMLPIASFYETAGSHINIDGTLQTFVTAVKPTKDAKPAWKVLKVLADLLKLTGFDYTNTTDITNEAIKNKLKVNTNNNTKITIKKPDINTITTIWQKSPYAIDALLRHATSLQKTKIGQLNNAWMNTKTAKKLKLTNDNKYLGIPIIISNKVAYNCVFIQYNNGRACS